LSGNDFFKRNNNERAHAILALLHQLERQGHHPHEHPLMRAQLRHRLQKQHQESEKDK